MRCRSPALALLVLLGLICLGCRNDNAPAPEADAEWERQNRRYEQQLNKGDEQIRRLDTQYDKADEQAKRMDALLDRWEKQADRYDKILDKWESQRAPGE
jgi:septal ring factor EnvC (AmiA/AmiB activator)